MVDFGRGKETACKGDEDMGDKELNDCDAGYACDDDMDLSTEREKIAMEVERMYGPHDRRFKTAIEIADAIRKGDK